jgi:ATP-dependent Clp protease ATP-binding subunit ClpB
MNFEKLTIKAQEVLTEATNLARKNENQQIEPVHLLHGMLDDDQGVFSAILKKGAGLSNGKWI